jgi:hypothetical protein
MFRTSTCPSSGGQILLSHHLVSSFSSGILYSRLQRATIPDAVIIQFVLPKNGMLMLETVENCNVTYILLMNKELCIKVGKWNKSIFKCFFFSNLSKLFKIHWNLITITGSLHEDRRSLMIKSRWIILRMKNSSDKTCRYNQNTHSIFNNFFFQKIVPSLRYLWKYSTARYATDNSITRNGE